MKGIEATIAVILLLLITVSIVGFAFVFFGRAQNTVQDQTEQEVENQLGSLATSFRIDAVSGSNVYIRNTGSNDIKNLAFYVDGQLVTHTGPATIAPSSIGAFQLLGQLPSSGVLKASSGVKSQETLASFEGPPLSQVAAPVFNPPAGTYAGAQSVSITTATVGATIWYRTDGTNPTCSTGTVYSSPVSVPTSTTLRAIGCASGMADSPVTIGSYTINPPPGDGTPYGGSAWLLPGTAQAENFNEGGEGVAYHDTSSGNNGGLYRLSEDVDIASTTDTGGGYVIGWMDVDEWMKWTVNVNSGGSYNLNARVASPNSGRSFTVKFGSGSPVTINVPNTGDWQAWQTVTVPVSLSAGQQIMLFNTSIGGFNLNWISVT